MGAGYSMRARNATSAEIYIYEDIGGWFGGVTAPQFVEDLRALGDVKQIELRINCYGGEIFEGMAIYRQLVEHPAKIVTHIDGVAASAASWIAMAGDEILIAESGFVMIHNAQGVAVGDAGDMRQMAAQLEAIQGAIVDIYKGRTKQSAEDLAAWMEAETWMTSAEAVERGFADQVVENMRLAAHVDVSKHKFNHLPQALANQVVQAPVIPAPAEPSPTAPNLSAAKARLARMRAKLTLAAPQGQAAA